MPTNDFIGFAAAGSANVMSQADYAAAAEQTDGVQPGPASSELANKIWRQGANMASAIGATISALGYNALDDGDIAALQIAFTNAMLDICDTGTWTPILTGTNTPGILSYTEQFGYYARIGKLCFIWARVQFTVSTVPTGNVIITGLPYNGYNANGNGALTAVGNNSFRRIFGGQVASSQLRLWAVNADTPYYKDAATWGASASDVNGYKVYNNSVFISGIYLIS